MNNPVTFGEWLRQRRNELGLTRKDFARDVGCSVSTLRKVEDDQRRPSVQIAELMANCLNIPPEERSTFVRVARGELSLDRIIPVPERAAIPNASSDATTSTPRTRTNLPVLPTPMIGRLPETEELIKLLGDPQCRLMTLVGPGGIGKTRLAIEVASGLQKIFVDGVFFIPLASINSTRFVVPVIVDSIGFPLQSTASMEPRKQLFNYLKEKQILLVVDNLEHLIADQDVVLFSELLTVAPKVKLLITSRESLSLQGEWVYEIQGLPVPETPQSEGFAKDTSIELFLQRARRADVGFNTSPDDFSAIIRICHLVQGTPLAIELAATWVRTLSCAEIAREIERGIDFLSVPTRDLPARHRSMRAVFDQSWKHLSEEEQTVLLQLTVFRGGFSREAAELVVGATLSVLSTLITKSLIRRSGMERYDLHELIRQFAAEQLTAQPEQRTLIHERHSSYFLTFFNQAYRSLRSSAQRETLAELTTEMDNFRIAWNWAITHHDLARACQVSATLVYVYELRAWLAEGEMVFREAAASIQAYDAEIESDDKVLIAMNAMRAHAAFFSFRLGKSAEAYAMLQPSAASLQSSRDQFAAIQSLWYLGIVCWELGKLEEANQSLQASLEKARVCRESWFEAAAGEFIGIVMHERGEYEQARRYFIEALAIDRILGDPMMTAHVLAYMGQTSQTLGETAEAEKFLRESLALAQAIGYFSGMGHALDGLGRLAQMTSSNESRALFTASYDAYKEMGDRRNMARVLSHQGYNSLALGGYSDAKNSFIAALHLAREGGFTPVALGALAGLAGLLAKQGDTEYAFELLLLVLSHPATSHETSSRAAHLRAELDAQLTNQQVEAIEARTQAKTLEIIVEEVLSRLTSREGNNINY